MRNKIQEQQIILLQSYCSLIACDMLLAYAGR